MIVNSKGTTAPFVRFAPKDFLAMTNAERLSFLEKIRGRREQREKPPRVAASAAKSKTIKKRRGVDLSRFSKTEEEL